MPFRTRILSKEERKYKCDREEVKQKVCSLEFGWGISICMHMYTCIRVCVSLLCPLKRPGNSDQRSSSAYLKNSDFGFEILILTKRNQCFLKKCLILDLGAGKVQDEPGASCNFR